MLCNVALFKLRDRGGSREEGYIRQNEAGDRYTISKTSPGRDPEFNYPWRITECSLRSLAFFLLSFYQGNGDISFKDIVFLFLYNGLLYKTPSLKNKQNKTTGLHREVYPTPKISP